MSDETDKTGAGNVIVTGEPGRGKTCLQSQIMHVLLSQSDVAQLQQRYGSEPFAETLRKNCNVRIILTSGDEHHGE
ncbi:hypothetical protein QF20_004719 [Salmonella enterica subsp. enterica]|nr:hypothetical protein [Salmonella enterica subsp. enterica serovar Ahuza]ECV7438469.1 hypothetical protein [Salmonella enterica subsp. enterica serovar Newport]EDD8831908.1 hypothetical protein [Salmonella enterica subsp. enterica serovar Mikawasima]HCP9902409.1 hypothetical protein [Salmonella enterica]EDW0323107.1 hypothetical protein [Salmonella enterica subsp. enterica serovar Mikawasima]